MSTEAISLELELAELFAALTSSLDHLHDGCNHEHGTTTIMLSGNNVGSAMRISHPLGPGDQRRDNKCNPVAYVNNNLEAIKNSTMVHGSSSSNDPGVHIPSPNVTK
ncbi:hypothetical protein Nepgr_033090 [Nepenthes gracilis]|uniref:Uncharacterized protein n=1 Tax=Nepenthes gracilis TaxID=150966 RepID=A0AAD3TM27_NEPGR|nr:hypothetical protein Nepgr_033090 [Nepenthes gracilis]